MERLPTFAALVGFITLMLGQAMGQYEPPAGYYEGANGLTGTALESALHDAIDNHQQVPWGWSAFQDLDTSLTDSSSVLLVYSNVVRSKNDHGGDAGEWNREHVWPKAFGLSGGSNLDERDLHNVLASDVQVNSERGSLYFDETDAAFENTPAHPSAPNCSKDSNSWEPQPSRKGDVARICFYMAVRYDGSDSGTGDLTLGDTPNTSARRMGKLSTLLRWHREDPVSDQERLRNHKIFTNAYGVKQGNRNPFVDQPLYAELLYLAESPETDFDEDGISDFWEAESLGEFSQDGKSDQDSDGVPLLLEYAFRMNPKASDDYLAPSLLDGTSEETMIIRFRWNRQMPSSVTYSLQSSPNLDPGSWNSAVTAPPDITDLTEDLRTVDFIVNADSTNFRFFRVRVTTSP